MSIHPSYRNDPADFQPGTRVRLVGDIDTVIAVVDAYHAETDTLTVIGPFGPNGEEGVDDWPLNEPGFGSSDPWPDVELASVTDEDRARLRRSVAINRLREAFRGA